MNIKINEPLFSTSRRYYTITLGVKHCDGRSELALIKSTFHVFSVFLTSIWNQLRQILQTNHYNSYQCRIQWVSASLLELSQSLLKFSCKLHL